MLERFARLGFKGCTEGEKHRIRATLLEALELARAGQRAREYRNRRQSKWRGKVALERQMAAARIPPSAKEPVATMPPEYWPTPGKR